MAGIFINYRTDDAGYAAALVYERLRAEFGERNVFRDCSSIPAGADFKSVLWPRLRQSAVLLVLIGPGWLTLADAHGKRRIDDPDDFVRREIVEAFACSLAVIPVLLDGAELPSLADLPEELAKLPWRQFVTLRVRHDGADLDHLVKELRRFLPGGAKATAAGDTPVAAAGAQYGGIQFHGPAQVNGDVVGRDKYVGGGAA